VAFTGPTDATHDKRVHRDLEARPRPVRQQHGPFKEPFKEPFKKPFKELGRCLKFTIATPLSTGVGSSMARPPTAG
jgi:hypothetical protein